MEQQLNARVTALERTSASVTQVLQSTAADLAASKSTVEKVVTDMATVAAQRDDDIKPKLQMPLIS